MDLVYSTDLSGRTHLEVARVAVPTRFWVQRLRGQNGAALAPEARRRPDEGLILRRVATPRAAAVEVPSRREPLPPEGNDMYVGVGDMPLNEPSRNNRPPLLSCFDILYTVSGKFQGLLMIFDPEMQLIFTLHGVLQAGYDHGQVPQVCRLEGVDVLLGDLLALWNEGGGAHLARVVLPHDGLRVGDAAVREERRHRVERVPGQHGAEAATRNVPAHVDPDRVDVAHTEHV